MVRKIEVIPHDPAWPKDYEDEANRVSNVLGPYLIAIHHIGSTAIDNIAAKPTVDILLVVTSHEKLETCTDEMRKLGYRSKGENGIPGRRYYQKLEGEVHKFHLHAFETEHPEIERHINFRDYLWAHPEEAQDYQELKLRLADVFPNDSQNYTSGKTALIRVIDQRAAAWRKESNIEIKRQM